VTKVHKKTDTNQVRPPIVVVLGHVDHGKTKMLDYLRQTKVVESEAGGITQHIGAYQIEHQGRVITLLDTPGHEAFSAIRSRGATVADIAILVVAADEGVKPQTKEAIKIIEQAKLPFIVALNKIDKENANLPRVKQDLAEHEVLLEDWGGKVPVVEVSALTGQGMDGLLEMILLLADVEHFSSDQSTTDGVVIESHIDSQRGQVATLLVHNGNLKISDWLVVGGEVTKIKALEDFRGQSLTEAFPSQPVVVLGWNTSPLLGEKFVASTSRFEADQLAGQYQAVKKPKPFTSAVEGKDKNKILNLVIRSDVASSLEAIDQALRTINSEEVTYRVVDYGVGNISDGDIKQAIATQALIVGFHVKLSGALQRLAERSGVRVETYSIIYELVESVRKHLGELLDPEIIRTPLGRLIVIAIFKREAKGQIVGGKVTSGKLKRGALVDVKRGDRLIISGRLGQLQQQKADVEEVVEGLEAGVRFDFPRNTTVTPNLLVREGDALEVYEEEKIAKIL